MDFSFSEEQLSFKESVIKFAHRELNNNLINQELKEEFFWDGWKKCADFGILALPISTKYGGMKFLMGLEEIK